MQFLYQFSDMYKLYKIHSEIEFSHFVLPDLILKQNIYINIKVTFLLKQHPLQHFVCVWVVVGGWGVLEQANIRLTAA